VFCLDLFSLKQKRRGRAAGAGEFNGGALRAEIEFCRRLAETYVRDRVIALLYRLPTTAYSQSFPVLLSDAAVAETEVQSLMQFFSEVETLNRGLDLAQTARESGDEQALRAEFERNLLKATRLMPPAAGGGWACLTASERRPTPGSTGALANLLRSGVWRLTGEGGILN